MSNRDNKGNLIDIQWFQHVQEIAVDHRSAAKLGVYFFTGVFPAFLSLASLCCYLSSSEEPKNSKPFFDYFHGTLPYCYASIAFEYTLCVLKKKKHFYSLSDTIGSLNMATMYLLVGFLTGWLTTYPYAWLREHYALFPDGAPFCNSLWMWVLVFVATELGYYWCHRFSHELNTLWALHVVHHSSNFFNVTTAVRQSALQGWFSWMFYLPLAFFFPLRAYLFCSKLLVLYQLILHTRIIDKFPAPVEFFFNTPSHHRAHHARNKQYLDKNYGGILIIFDRLFGTFEREGEEPKYGLAHYEVQTWNIFYRQFHQFSQIQRAAQATPGFLNKIRVWIDRKPGYNYCLLNKKAVLEQEELDKKKRRGELSSVPSAEEKKPYDSYPSNSWLTLYCALQSCFVLLVGPYLVNHGTLLSLETRTACVVYLLVAMHSLSRIFDQASFSIRFEEIRLASSLLLSLFVPQDFHEVLPTLLESKYWEVTLIFHLASLLLLNWGAVYSSTSNQNTRAPGVVVVD